MVLFNFSSNRSSEGSTNIRPLSIAFGEGAATIGYSVDGIKWNYSNNEVFSIRANHGCWNGKVWVGVGTGGNWVATSYDGINWIGQDNNILSEGYYVSWNGTVFLAAGVAMSSTPNITFATSTDGFLWTAVSTDVFYNGYANWVGWTGNVWCATGSGGVGGNTSATSISIYGDTWSGANNIVTDLSSIITDMVSTYSSSSGVASNAFDKTTNTQLEWRTSSASYDAMGSPTNCVFSTAIGSISNTVSGEFLQISAASSVVLKYYLMLFNISGGDALYETPRSWYLLGANSENPDFWNIIDRTQSSLSNPPSYGLNGYYAICDVLNNTISYQYYRILITSTFNDNSYYKNYYARIMKIDLFYSCPTTTTISSHIKPFITSNGISYPVKMKNNYYLVYTDRTNSLVSPPIHGVSYYSSDISCISDITCSAYDGINYIVGSKNNLYYTANFGKTWNITTVTTENIGMQIYGAAFNGNYFILGGGDSVGGNVLLYGKSENGLNNWYPCINSNNIFTKVRGVISNSGYGYTVPNNSVYLDLGDKMNIVTPKSYPPIGGDIQFSFNLNTFPVSF